VGDANRSEVATYLKVGTTAIVLAMIEDDVLGSDLVLANPVAAIRHVSHDPTLTRTVLLKDGRRITALELQWQLFELARKYERERGLACVGDDVGADVLHRWEDVLTHLESDRSRVATVVEWVAKERVLSAYMERHGTDWFDARVRALDLQYHDLRPERSLFDRMGMERLATDEGIEEAVTEPPLTTRAYFRGKCLQKWPQEVVAANWDSMVFDVGREPLRRVPMMEPLRGTAAHVARLIEECTTASELLQRLGA
jgi:proteasome accessory factor A